MKGLHRPDSTVGGQRARHVNGGISGERSHLHHPHRTHQREQQLQEPAFGRADHDGWHSRLPRRCERTLQGRVMARVQAIDEVDDLRIDVAHSCARALVGHASNAATTDARPTSWSVLRGGMSLRHNAPCDLDMPPSSQLRLEFDSVEALRESYDSNLRKGRAFIPGHHTVAERELCEVVLVHPDSGLTFTVVADAVWVNLDPPGPGVGVQFENFGDARQAELKEFVEQAAAEPGPPVADEAPADTEGAALETGRAFAVNRPRNVHERIRTLSLRERESTARQGTLAERVALERCFGASVWEALLQNPQLTSPEVMRIAKNGNLPKPLVGQIVSNAAWVAKPEVQRALLSNPRVAGQHLERVLRAMSQADLTRVAQQSSYRMPVRAAAKKLLRK